MAISRSENMRRIRGKNTRPELLVRHLLRNLGYTGYRLHRSDLPGKPDIAFVGRRKAILVHGCFWHGHDCAEGSRVPKTNADFWISKIARNTERDTANREALINAGWDILVVWECEISSGVLREELVDFMESRRSG